MAYEIPSSKLPMKIRIGWIHVHISPGASLSRLMGRLSRIKPHKAASSRVICRRRKHPTSNAERRTSKAPKWAVCPHLPVFAWIWGKRAETGCKTDAFCV
jgi:hypothetical protein